MNKEIEEFFQTKKEELETWRNQGEKIEQEITDKLNSLEFDLSSLEKIQEAKNFARIVPESVAKVLFFHKLINLEEQFSTKQERATKVTVRLLKEQMKNIENNIKSMIDNYENIDEFCLPDGAVIMMLATEKTANEFTFLDKIKIKIIKQQNNL